MDSHLQSKMREHLDFACVKLNSTQVQLNEQRVQLVETQAKLSCLTVEDGRKKRFIWKIKSFTESLRLAKEGVKRKIESDPFYTGCYGYKLKVFAYPYHIDHNGISRLERFRSPYLSIGIVLMEGEYDDILTWPFSKKITFTVIDQNKDLKERKNHVVYLSQGRHKVSYVAKPVCSLFSERPGEKMMTVEGKIPQFISQETLQRRPFIVNDTLFIQVDIEPDD